MCLAQHLAHSRYSINANSLPNFISIKAIFGYLKNECRANIHKWLVILAVLFQGSRESGFYYTCFSSRWTEALNTEIGIYSSLLIQKSRRQSQVSRGNHKFRDVPRR